MSIKDIAKKHSDESIGSYVKDDSLSESVHFIDVDIPRTEYDALEKILISTDSNPENHYRFGNITVGSYGQSSSMIDRIQSKVRGELNYVKDINLSYLGLSSVDESLGDLTVLEGLNVSRNQIEYLPKSFSRLKKLQSVSFEGTQLKEIPESIGSFEHLRMINSEDTQIESLPDSICDLDSLEILHLENIRSLKSLPENIGKMKKLKHINLINCVNVEVPESILDLPTYATLYFGGVNIDSDLSFKIKEKFSKGAHL